MGICENPYSYVKDLIVETTSSYIAENLTKNLDEVKEVVKSFIEEPPRREFGDFSLPAPRLSRVFGLPLKQTIEGLINSLKKVALVDRIDEVNNYVNIYLNYSMLSELVFNSIREAGLNYGRPCFKKPKRVVVEYISANPVHPLHIGSGRNAVLGDFLYRLFKFVGYDVERRYYVNDVGLQTAFLAFGYSILNKPKPPIKFKPDHYYGLIYAATSIIIEISKIRKKLKEAGMDELPKLSELQRDLDILLADLSRVKERIPEEVDKLMEEITREENPEGKVNEIMRNYERLDPNYNFVREVSEEVVKGIAETLDKLNVGIDVWDWESDVIRSGVLKEVLEKAKASPYYGYYKGVPALMFRDLLNDENVKTRLKIPKALEVPPLILMRSDGSTLYTTRDIAYTLIKFRSFNADEVINVIAVEQILSQAQLRLALYALGYVREAENLIHYSYEMVNLPGMSMSGRRAKYVTVDELLESMASKVKNVMKDRGVEVTEEQALKIARSAFKFMILSTSPSKTLVVDVSRALDLKQNSGPYMQYTYVRAKSILDKVDNHVDWNSIDYSKSVKEPVKTLIWELSKFPEVISKTLESLQPEGLATYLIKVADLYNNLYDAEPILKEVDKGYRELKLAVTYGVAVVLKNGMEVLGLDVLDRM